MFITCTHASHLRYTRPTYTTSNAPACTRLHHACTRGWVVRIQPNVDTITQTSTSCKQPATAHAKQIHAWYNCGTSCLSYGLIYACACAWHVHGMCTLSGVLLACASPTSVGPYKMRKQHWPLSPGRNCCSMHDCLSHDPPDAVPCALIRMGVGAELLRYPYCN